MLGIMIVQRCRVSCSPISAFLLISDLLFLSTGLVMDIRNLEFEDDSFDVAIDKGILSLVGRRSDSLTCPGTMDAMMTTKGDVWVRLPHHAS